MENLDKLLTMINVAGEIRGRKKIQKIAYILQSKGLDLEVKFKFHHYGPYSAELQLELDYLEDANLLNEICIDTPPCKHSLTEKGLSQHIEHPDVLEHSDLIKRLNSVGDTNILEVASTIYYLRNNGINDENALLNKLKILKPKLQNSYAKAFDLYHELEHHEGLN